MPELCRIYAPQVVMARGNREVEEATREKTYPYIGMILTRIVSYKADCDEWMVPLDEDNVLRSTSLENLRKAVQYVCDSHGWLTDYKEAKNAALIAARKKRRAI